MSGFSIEKKMDEIDVARMLADKRVRRELNCILVELARAEQLHPVWPDNDGEAVDIIEEQLIDAVFVGHPGEARTRKIRSTAAVCIRYLINTERER